MDEQVYYHYLSLEDAMDDLENKRIKVSRLDELNDPFEWKPYKRYKFKERQPYNRIFKKMLEKWYGKTYNDFIILTLEREVLI